MIDYLKKQYEKELVNINRFNENLKTCDICKGVGSITKKPIMVKQFHFDIPEICNCQMIDDNYGRFEVEEKIKTIVALNDEIEFKIPDNYKSIDFDNIDSRIKNFMKSPMPFMWICGDVGRGKTHALYAVKLQRLLNGKDMDILKEYDWNYETPKKYQYKLVSFDDVILEGNEARNQSMVNYLYQIIDMKYENNTKMIFTSNFHIDQFIEKCKKIDGGLGSRIYSRMSGKTLVVKIDGENRRV